MELTTGQVIMYMWSLTLVAIVIATVAVAFLVYLIVRLLNPKAQATPAVPSFHTVREAFAAVNGWPKPEKGDESDTPDVASAPKVTQVLGMADEQAKTDRDEWWEEQRAAGRTDEEIGAEELSNVVDLG